jgi:hypothetical protein
MPFLILTMIAFAISSGGSGVNRVCDVQVVCSGVPAIDPVYSDPAVADEVTMDAPENHNEPGFELYQKGYHLVLDEKWTEARKNLQTFIKKYPRSGYVDDACYWSAYALKHIDRKSAIDAYIRFITKFPNSRYYDDAVADLTELSNGHPVTIGRYIDDEGTRVYVSGEGRGISLDSSGAVIRDHSDSIVVDRHGKPLKRSGKGFEFSFGYAPRALDVHEKSLSALSRALGHLRFPPFIAPFGPMASDQHLDKTTRLKIQALQALGESKDDSGAFVALRKVALDGSNANPLRVAAMEELSDMQISDPLPVFVDIAKRDTDKEIQNFAIDEIGLLSKDKNRSVETLIGLFDAIPKIREDRREEIFFSIAEVGNDKAVDFLSRVARSDENYDLRGQAIYYLGSIGTPKARTALLEILQK